MTYKEYLHQTMISFTKNPKVRFVGYNTKFGPKMNGTLSGCEEACIETPCAENLMTGIAMGLALEGFLPVLCFERFDFCLAAADALINHLCNLQAYGFNLPIIIRVCVGNDYPLDPGHQHKQDYEEFFGPHLCGIRLTLDKIEGLKETNFFQKIMDGGLHHPIMLIEYRSMYNKEVL